MTIEINQRGERDWAVYSDGDYKGTVSAIGTYPRASWPLNEFVCTHTQERFSDREAAVQFLVQRS